MSKLDMILQRLDTVDETVSGLAQQVQNLGRTVKVEAQGEISALRGDLTSVFVLLHEYQTDKKKLPHLLKM